MPQSVLIPTIVILTLAFLVTILFWDYLSAREGPTAIVRNIGLVAGGLIAGVIALWRSVLASEQVAVAKQEQYHARFQKAYESISEKGMKSGPTRLAGMLAFEHLIRDEPQLASDVHDVLVVFIRHLSPEEHLPDEFQAAQEAAHEACDAMEEFKLEDKEEVDSMRSSIRAAARDAATRMGIRTVS